MPIPDQITAGDSISWTDGAARDNLGNAVASPSWSLTYIIRGSTALTLTAVPDGGGWKTTISAAQSATLTPGVHYWQATATNGSERVTIGAGQIKINENLAYSGSAAAFDGRTQAQADLDAVRAEMRARISGGSVQEYTIGNRSLKKMPMADLIAMEGKLKIDVAREARANRLAKGLNSGRAVYVRF